MSLEELDTSEQDDLSSNRLLKSHSDGSEIVGFHSEEDKKLAQQIDSDVEKIFVLATQVGKRYSTDKSIDDEDFQDLCEKIFACPDPIESLDISPSSIVTSKKQIVKNALKIVQKCLKCQSASIFLFSKYGQLERAGIYGFDKDGKEVLDSWFDSESYSVGLDSPNISFTGKAATPLNNGKYGRVQSTKSLQSEDLSKESSENYIDKFGSLNCAIAIPLNGQNRTYGVLRVINRLDDSSCILKEPFSESDIEVLLVLGAFVSNALSNFRRNFQFRTFLYVSRILLKSTFSTVDDLKEIFEKIVNLLVESPETPFQVAILRVRDESTNSFKVHAIESYPKELKDKRDDTPIESKSSGVLWKILGEGKRLIVQDLQNADLRSQFRNREWIERNHFSAFGCFPLSTDKGDIFGSLSVYVGLNYKFYPDSIEFLQGIVDLLALSIMKIKDEEKFQDMQRVLLPNGEEPLDNEELRSDAFIEQDIEQEFTKLADAWKEETRLFPILSDRFRNSNYCKIIELGENVVPYLIRELSRRPDHWFFALESILKLSPVKDEERGKISCMVKAWIDWGGKQGYVFE
jgi:GAF domain-containing protein